MKIEIVNPIEARVDFQGSKHLRAILSYEGVFWKRGPFGMRRHTYQKSLMRKSKDGYQYFLAGFVPRIKREYPTAVIQTMYEEGKEKFSAPALKGITFRPDQLNLIKSAIKAKRGLVQSPTGTGKTILQLGIISAMPKDFCCLVLAHTKDIVNQTHEELKKFGFGSKTQLVTEGNRPRLTKPIVVATIQTFSKYSVDDYITYFDMFIIDECHHLSSQTTTYANVLNVMLAPYRFGFTATQSPNKEAQMAVEGLIGPVVAKLTINEAAELKIIAKPKLKLIKLPENHSVRQNCRSYDDVVKHGIVNSVARTEKIATLVQNGVKRGRAVLVMVTQIEHGQKIQAALEERGVKVPFVHGGTDSLERIKVKNDLTNKKILAAICTTIWKEGVNIPSLNGIILAHLGKSELVTLQNIGRGLRRTNEKDTVTIIDFFDNSHRYLVSHFGERLCLYFDMGWV